MGQRLGVLLVGISGAVATTVTAGVYAARRGVVEPVGLVTELPEFRDLPLVGLDDLVFSGWDLRTQPHVEWLRRHAIVPQQVAQAVADDMAAVATLRAPRFAPLPRALLQDGVPLQAAEESRQEAVERLKAEITAFRTAQGLSGVVVVNLGSTEARPSASVTHASPESFEEGLGRNDPSISPGMVYAYAAIAAGAPYVNFTPSVTADIQALVELARLRGVALAGKDAKTGQTLYKTVLAPMLRWRNLRVRGWYSTNLLGNGDGLVLRDPSHGATKLETKSAVLAGILGYSDFDHQVHIHYYPPRGDAKEAWDAIDFVGWLGVPMSLRVNWQGQDSVLAAPLVLDLVRMTWLAQQRGESGVAAHLASFFKAPMGATVHDFFRQMQMLLDYCAAVRASTLPGAPPP